MEHVPVDPIASLLARWEADATTLRRRGADREAAVLELAAAELTAARAEWETERLTLGTAALESGLSYSALEKAVRHGRIRNSGTKGAPRVRRGDLPRKGQSASSPDLSAHVLACARTK